MKKIEDLKRELFQKLEKYPKIEAFFKDSLQERLAIDDSWTENILVQDILDELFSEGDALHELIDAISKDPPNYKVLQEKLAPKDDYDKKMHDVLAELNGYYHLKKSGFTEIKAILESASQKTPDFFAKHNNKEYLFEVKNMRSPTDVTDVLFDKINERRLMIPEAYENLKLRISLSDAWDEVYFETAATEIIRLRVLAWLGKIFYLVEAGESFETVSTKPFIYEFKGVKLRIEFMIESSNQFQMIGIPGTGKLIDNLFEKNKILPFSKKALRIIDRAILQLFEYDKDDRYPKYILLNWQKHGSLILIKEEKLNAIVKGFDGLLNSIWSNLHTKLLNVDTLP